MSADPPLFEFRAKVLDHIPRQFQSIEAASPDKAAEVLGVKTIHDAGNFSGRKLVSVFDHLGQETRWRVSFRLVPEIITVEEPAT